MMEATTPATVTLNGDHDRKGRGNELIDIESLTPGNHINGYANSCRNTTNTFQYLEWQKLYETEKPFQILLDIVDDAPEQRRHNLVFHDGPLEVVHDVRGRESDHNLDKNGFTYIKRASKMEPGDFIDLDKVEKVFLSELEAMLKEIMDGVD